MTYPNPASLRTLGAALGLAVLAALLLILPSSSLAASSGGVGPGGTTETTPGSRAKLVDGKAIPPADAPRRVVRAIKAANSIEDKPYRLGGGHGRWVDDAYDCSGAVSFTLGKYGAKVLKAPMPSGSFTRWEEPGAGKWITTYANGGHMYVVIAGLRFDTANTPGNGPGWAEGGISSDGYSVRHPAGL